MDYSPNSRFFSNLDHASETTLAKIPVFAEYDSAHPLPVNSPNQIPSPSLLTAPEAAGEAAWAAPGSLVVHQFRDAVWDANKAGIRQTSEPTSAMSGPSVYLNARPPPKAIDAPQPSRRWGPLPRRFSECLFCERPRNLNFGGSIKQNNKLFCRQHLQIYRYKRRSLSRELKERKEAIHRLNGKKLTEEMNAIRKLEAEHSSYSMHFLKEMFWRDVNAMIEGFYKKIRHSEQFGKGIVKERNLLHELARNNGRKLSLRYSHRWYSPPMSIRYRAFFKDLLFNYEKDRKAYGTYKDYVVNSLGHWEGAMDSWKIVEKDRDERDGGSWDEVSYIARRLKKLNL